MNPHPLRDYLNSLGRPEQEAFAQRCGTTLHYLRKALSVGQRFSATLAIAIERESRGGVRCEQLRPDTDWAYLRNSRRRKTA